MASWLRTLGLERARRLQAEDDAAWNAWFDARLEECLGDERDFIIEDVGLALSKTMENLRDEIDHFLLERGVAVRQGLRFLRAELPRILATSPDVLSARMVRVIRDLAEDWRRLDERIDQLSSEIAVLARQDAGCERLMSVPGIGPIISSAMVAAIGTGEAFSKGRDFAAWLGPGLGRSAAYCTFSARLIGSREIVVNRSLKNDRDGRRRLTALQGEVAPTDQM